MKNVVIGFLGNILDHGGKHRWERWRPSVDLCRHDDLLIDRFDLIFDPKFQSLADVVIQDIGTVSPATKVVQHRLSYENPWDFEEVYAGLHDFAVSYPAKPEKENYMIHVTTGSHVMQICLFLLTEARYLPGALLQASPPGRRNSGEPGTYSTIDLDLSKYDRISSRFEKESMDDIRFLKLGIETKNKAFNQLIENIERVAIRSRDPVHLSGATGAGKSNMARRIFKLRKQRQGLAGDFVAVNCATLRGDAAMSTLFGHRKGAFTGAAADRPGLLKAADRGILFLDEIGELGLDEQAMLLRAIEQKLFLPMGSDKEVSSNFQLISGTNRDLRADVAKGDFREDLLARINLWSFELPGLKERREDIEPNFLYELARVQEKSGRQTTINKEALKLFLTFAESPEAEWRANFRDLNAATTRMSVLAEGGRIDEAVVRDEIERLKLSWAGASREAGDSNAVDELMPAKLDRFDRAQLAEVLRVCRKSRNMSEAGRALFDVSRLSKKSSNDSDRLRKYLAKFEIQWDQFTSKI